MIDGLKSHSKVSLDVNHTPLEFMPSLSAELGVKLWVKRDDCLPFTLDGNKLRQLEYYLGPVKKLWALIAC